MWYKEENLWNREGLHNSEKRRIVLFLFISSMYFFSWFFFLFFLFFVLLFHQLGGPPLSPSDLMTLTNISLRRASYIHSLMLNAASISSQSYVVNTKGGSTLHSHYSEVIPLTLVDTWVIFLRLSSCFFFLDLRDIYYSLW